MEQQELFDDLPKSAAADKADPPHMAFMFGYKGVDIALPPSDARALFAAIGNFLQTLEALKNGRK